MLVATGKVPRECGVQIPLIDLLCDRGADPDCAAQAAAVLFELDAVRSLLARRARLTLPLAAALGQVDEASRLLPKADAEKRHLALALAAQYGHAEIVRVLLDAGENPNRFNPVGAHSHSTPLHQAALYGHLAVVKFLIERGAQTNVKDILFGGTPAGWADYAGKKDVVAYFQTLETSEPSEKPGRRS
jgi:ankyrin repeat protein